MMSVIMAIAAVVTFFSESGGTAYLAWIAAGGVLAFAVTTLVLSVRGAYRQAGIVFIVVSHLLICVIIVASRALDLLDVLAPAIFLILAAFYISPRAAVVLGAITAASFLATAAVYEESARAAQSHTSVVVLGIFFISIVTVLLFAFARQARFNAEAHRLRLQHDEALFQQVPAAASQLGAAARQIFGQSRAQLEGAVRQASAVEETRQFLHSLASASEQIVSASAGALTNAETTLGDAERMAQHIGKLAEHAGRIAAILESIKALAGKSDLLALNAALEGTRAGEVGRGFSLVASQMQRLAENTARAVRDIQVLTHDIHDSVATARASTEETTRLAKLSAQAAREIAAVIDQQRSGVAQVAIAVDDLSAISSQVKAANEETIVSTEGLTELAENLAQMVIQFKAAAEGHDAVG